MNDEDKQYFDKLKGHLDALHKLIEDPQPGLFSWCQMFGEQMAAIEEMWTRIDRQDAVDQLGKIGADTACGHEEAENILLGYINACGSEAVSAAFVAARQRVGFQDA